MRSENLPPCRPEVDWCNKAVPIPTSPEVLINIDALLLTPWAYKPMLRAFPE